MAALTTTRAPAQARAHAHAHAHGTSLPHGRRGGRVTDGTCRGAVRGAVRGVRGVRGVGYRRYPKASCASAGDESAGPSSGGSTTLSNLDALLGEDTLPSSVVENNNLDDLKKTSDGSSGGDENENLATKKRDEDTQSTTATRPVPTTTPSVFSRREDDDPDGGASFGERALCASCYLLPLLDALKFSRYLLRAFPAAALLLLPIAPVAEVYANLGFFQVLVFFAIYFGIAQNRQDMSPFARFHAQQAILLDLIIILPDALSRLFVGADGAVPRDGIALEAMTLLFNTTFLYVWFCSGGGFFSSLAGKRPKLPLVGDVAEQQAER
ncbi:chloroplast import apparatus Tic20 protein [Pycnococcus provasolii]